MICLLVAGQEMAPAAYFVKHRKATFLHRHFYTIFTPVGLRFNTTKGGC
jgi:hypothetical protein